MQASSGKREAFDLKALSDATLENELGFQEEHFQLFNEAARGLFLQKRWEDAADAYFFLTVVRPLQPTFWLGLGMAERKRERLPQAVQAFSMAALLLYKDPYPSLLLAKSLEAAGEHSEALLAVDRAIRLAREQEGAEQLLVDAEALKEKWIG